MDSVSKAKQELAVVRIRIERDTARAAELETYLRVHSSLADPPEPTQDAVARILARSQEARKRDMGAKQRIGEAAEGFLKAISPLTTAQIVERLEQAGIEINGQDKVAYVSQILSRSDQFVGRRGVGWSLAPEKGGEEE